MQTVFITGANKGLGYEIAKQLGQRGFKVFIGVRDEAKGRATLDALRAEGVVCEAVSIDVSQPESITQAADQLRTMVTHLDVLINNAAINHHEGTNILEASPQVITETIQTNAIGLLYVTQALTPLLQAGSRIINVSGMAGLSEKGISTIAPVYSLSKTMVNIITRQTARAMRGKKISVNACCPGWTRTEMGGPKGLKSIEEGADTAVWLATEAPSDLHGRFVSDRTVKNHW